MASRYIKICSISFIFMELSTEKETEIDRERAGERQREREGEKESQAGALLSVAEPKARLDLTNRTLGS